MRLYLMRHGQASNMADTDHERPLTQKGRSRSESTARILANLEIAPDVIFASPRVRAQETAQIISEAINVPVTTSDLVNFSFDIDSLEVLIGGMEYDAEVLFIGHNPSMSEVAEELTGTSISLKTGAIACVDVDPDDLEAGQLQWLVTSKIFAAIDD